MKQRDFYNRINEVTKCIDYILEHEKEDFRHFPSDNHIYFHAMVAAHGIAFAQETLNDIMESYFNDQEIKGGE